MIKQTRKNRKLKIKQNIVYTLIFVLAFVFSELITRTEWLDGLDNFYYDLWHNMAGVRENTSHVVIVAVDDQVAPAGVAGGDRRPGVGSQRPTEQPQCRDKQPPAGMGAGAHQPPSSTKGAVRSATASDNRT